MTQLAALSLGFLILVAGFWWQVRRAARYWWNRDSSETLIPSPRNVHHAERILRVAAPTPTTTLKDLIAGIRAKDYAQPDA